MWADLLEFLLRHLEQLPDPLSDGADAFAVPDFDEERDAEHPARVLVEMGHREQMLIRSNLQLVPGHFFHAQLQMGQEMNVIKLMNMEEGKEPQRPRR
jgi:hypothetical protein